jgi:hypothetical protein
MEGSRDSRSCVAVALPLINGIALAVLNIALNGRNQTFLIPLISGIWCC